ncbi:winged helix-turn-helix domain-containing protein, partial [Frankia sp. Cpl3]|nr:winged helix-turn-helix domain-containing protein [Frankia sp. Cpl3]
NAYPDITIVAALIGDPTRAAMLHELMDGRALPASELAYVARVSPQTASAHLAKMVDGNLLALETQGRHRYYRLASQQVAHVLEVLSTISPPVEVRSLRQSQQLQEVRFARTCYDHLAGKLGVSITQYLLENGFLAAVGQDYQITTRGEEWCRGFGINLEQTRQKRRAFARPCLDWSERRHHLAGTLGTAIASRFFELGWIAKAPTSRAVRITEQGREQLVKQLGIDLA